jgi:hypothetical protein
MIVHAGLYGKMCDDGVSICSPLLSFTCLIKKTVYD